MTALPLLLFSLFLNTCKAKEKPIQQSPQPSRYFYRDAELPFGFTLDASYLKDVFVWRNDPIGEHRGKYNVHLSFHPSEKFGLDDFDWDAFSIDLYDAEELEGYIRKGPSLTDAYLSTSTLCFREFPYEDQGVKSVPIKLFNQGGLTPPQVLARLYTYKYVDTGCSYEGGDEPCPEHELYWIVINQAPHLPQGKAIRIRINFPTIYKEDKPETIKVKKQTTKFLCDTAKSFVWVNFGNKFSSERWKEVKWIDAPQPEVHISDEK